MDDKTKHAEIKNMLKATYEEHVSEGKKYKSASEYGLSNKSAYFYSLPRIRLLWPDKKFNKDCGWVVNRQPRVEKASYEEHVELCKQFNCAYAYTRAKKANRFYTSITGIKSAWPSCNIEQESEWCLNKSL
jgi:hypothetical protein